MPIASHRVSRARPARQAIAAALSVMPLLAGPALAQDAAQLVDQTLTGTNPNGDNWAAYYAPDGTLYTLNSTAGISFVESYEIRDGQLCYLAVENFPTQCWDVRVDADQVIVSSEERGSFTQWTLRPGDPLNLQEPHQTVCVPSEADANCA